MTGINQHQTQIKQPQSKSKKKHSHRQNGHGTTHILACKNINVKSTVFSQKKTNKRRGKHNIHVLYNSRNSINKKHQQTNAKTPQNSNQTDANNNLDTQK